MPLFFKNKNKIFSSQLNLIRVEIFFAAVFCFLYGFTVDNFSSLIFSKVMVISYIVGFIIIFLLTFFIRFKIKRIRFLSNFVYLSGMLLVVIVGYQNNFNKESFFLMMINYGLYCFTLSNIKVFLRINAFLIITLFISLLLLNFQTETPLYFIFGCIFIIGFAGYSVSAGRSYYRKKIKNREQILNIIFNHSSEGLVLFDNKKRIIIEVNEKAIKTLGLKNIKEEKNIELKDIKINGLNIFSDFEVDKRKIIELEDQRIFSFLVKKIDGIKKNFFLLEIKEYNNRQELSTTLEFDKLKSITEESYENLFNSSASLICVIGKDEKLVDINKTMLEFLGYTPEEVLGKAYYTFDNKDYTKERIKINNLAWEGKEQLFEKEILAKNGEVIHIEVILRKAKYFGKEVLISNSRDISERKLLQKIAEYNFSQYLILFKESPIAHVVSDLDGDIIETNDYFNQMIGYKREEILGKNVRFFSNQEDMKENLVERNKLIDGSISKIEMQKRYITKNGETVNGLLKIIIQKDENNKASKLLAQIVNVTEFVKAEEKTKESEKSYKDVFNNSYELLYILDRENKFIDVNKAVVDEYGYKKEKVLGQTPVFFAAEGKNDLQVVMEKIELAWKGKDQEMLWWSKRKNGSEFPKNLHLRKGIYFGKEVLMCSGRNISEEFEYKRKLIKSEKKYKDLINKTIFGILIFNGNTVVFANNKAVHLLEYKNVNELIGKHSDDVIKIKDVVQHEKRVADIKAGKNVKLEEFELITASKKIVSVESKPTTIEYEGEICVLSTFVNISDRKQAEVAKQKIIEAKSVNTSLKKQLEQNRLIQRRLQNSQSYSEGIIESSLDMIFTTDIKGKITKLNSAAKQELILKEKEFLKKPFEILLKNKEAGEDILKILNKKNAFSGEIEMRRSDGTHFPAFLSISYLFNTDGAFLGIMGVSRDISDIISKEQEIKEQASKLTSIIETSSHFFFTINKNNRITSFNELFKSDVKLKLDIDLELFDDFFKTFNSDRKGKEAKEFEKFWKDKLSTSFSGGSCQFEVERKSIDGTLFYREIFLNPIYSESGKIEEVSGIAHDTTQKKLYEIELTNSLSEKEILLKEVHHRVKNNMQVISSILNLQSSYVDDEAILAILRESQNRIRAMASIHERLYRTENFSDIKFSSYVRNLAESLVHTYELSNTSVELVFSLDEVFLTLNAAIPCGLIINELISNSLKYAFEGREEGKIEITLQQSGEIVTLVISDDGVGIPKTIDLEKVDTLGLQLVSTLVDQIEGKVEIEKEKGTAFSIVFNSNLEE